MEKVKFTKKNVKNCPKSKSHWGRDDSQQHIAYINSIESQDELLSYDVTTGYPEQLVFNV